MNGVLLKRKMKRKEKERERARISRSALVKTLLLTFVHSHQDKGTLEQDNEADGKVLSVFRNFSSFEIIVKTMNRLQVV